jgi:transcriptional regulator with XRE-family HTH domain
MVIGNRLKELRESKELSQGDIEKRTGLLRCYISRVENGHTVPAVSTLEKMATALEVPMYQLFHDGEASASVRKLNFPKDRDDWGSTGATGDYFYKLRRLLAKMGPDDQSLLLHMAQKVAKHHKVAKR